MSIKDLMQRTDKLIYFITRRSRRDSSATKILTDFKTGNKFYVTFAKCKYANICAFLIKTDTYINVHKIYVHIEATTYYTLNLSVGEYFH